MRRPAAFLLAALLTGPAAAPAQTAPTFGDTPAEGGEVRSAVTLRLRKGEQKLVFHVRDPRTGSELVEEVSYQPGK